jgi:hypothetical protein
LPVFCVPFGTDWGFHLLHPQGKGFAPRLPGVIKRADTKDQQTVYCRSHFGIYRNRNPERDCLRLSPSRPGSCVGRYRGRTPFLAPRQDFSTGPLLFLGDRNNPVVRCLRDFVPFQYARSVEQHRDGSSSLGQLRTWSTASPRYRAFTCPVSPAYLQRPAGCPGRPVSLPILTDNGPAARAGQKDRVVPRSLGTLRFGRFTSLSHELLGVFGD